MTRRANDRAGRLRISLSCVLGCRLLWTQQSREGTVSSMSSEMTTVKLQLLRLDLATDKEKPITKEIVTVGSAVRGQATPAEECKTHHHHPADMGIELLPNTPTQGVRARHASESSDLVITYYNPPPRPTTPAHGH